MSRKLWFGLIAALAIGFGGASARTPVPAAAAPPGPPPQLWSVETSGPSAPARPVRICANRTLHEGFTAFRFSVGGANCTPGNVYRHGAGENYKCTLNGHEFGVAVTVQGAPDRDFVASSSVTDVDASRTVYRRALHFTRLGPCPAGWAIGQATDQSGRRVTAAFVDGTDIAAYPPGGR